MAEYYRPREEEAGIDKFLRRLGAGAQVVKTGFDVYNAPLERKAKEAQLKQLETETALLPEKYAREKGLYDLTVEEKKGNIKKTEAEMSGLPEKQKREKSKGDLELEKTKLEIEKGKKELADPQFKLNSTEKQQVFFGNQGLKAIGDMDKALAGGATTFSLIGDNPYTLSARYAAEMFGRMQSGGAINKEEEAKFMKLLPSPTDDEATQRLKLQKAQEVFAAKVAAYNVQPQNLATLTYGAKQPKAVQQPEVKEYQGKRFVKQGDMWVEVK